MTVRVLSSSIIAWLVLWAPVSYARAPHVVSPAPSVSVFAPSVISGPAHDSAPAFTSDGNTVYFGRSNPAQSAIYVSHRHGSHWSEPDVAPFSGIWNDMEPAFAPDGSWLVFVSNRPAREGESPIEATYNGSTQKGGNLWRVDRRGDGWSEPVRLSNTVNTNASTFAPSVAADGSLWFMTTDSSSGKFRLYRSQFRKGHYETAQPLPFSDGRATDVDPVVAPDESFVVFGSGRMPKRSIDLFIAFRDGGKWGEPVWLGDAVNSPGSDAEPRLSLDLKTLYFSSERVVPVTFPRSQAQAREDTARMLGWDNGNYNIWSTSLQPWLDAHRHAQIDRGQGHLPTVRK